MQGLRVDGGASVNRFLLQFQADILRRTIDRPRMVETTAMGAAFLAGLHTGVWKNLEDIARIRLSDAVFVPRMEAEQAEACCRPVARGGAPAGAWE